MTRMTVATPDPVRQRAAAAPETKIARPEASQRSRLNVLRGLLWSFGLAMVVVQAVFLARSHPPGFTWLPLVIFSTGAAATVWHIRRIKRQSLVPARIRSTPRRSDDVI